MKCRLFVRWGFAAEFELTLTHPQHPWKMADAGVGGHAVAASGISESFVVREDDVLLLEPRVLESELPQFRQFLRWARSSGTAFTIRLDVDEPLTEFQVLLDSPTWDSTPRVEYVRDPEYPGLFFVPFGVRPEFGGTFDVSWFALGVGA